MINTCLTRQETAKQFSGCRPFLVPRLEKGAFFSASFPDLLSVPMGESAGLGPTRSASF